MSSAAFLRPGMALGAYPQSEDRRDSWLDQFANSGMNSIRHLTENSPREFNELVERINAVSEGLQTSSEEELAEHINALRKRLYSEGLEDELIVRSFALIREMSWRKLGMRHHDVQLYGGWVMLKGMIAEMETGEGKTLTATLPACTAALAGIPVHVVTVNDFLVSRDAEWMTPVYKAMNLSVGTITETMNLTERKAAYACDITYCTNKQLVFDYLKDRILLDQENRRLHLQLEKLYAAEPRTSVCL